MCETKNAVVNSEAETSSGALQSERKNEHSADGECQWWRRNVIMCTKVTA